MKTDSAETEKIYEEMKQNYELLQSRVKTLEAEKAAEVISPTPTSPSIDQEIKPELKFGMEFIVIGAFASGLVHFLLGYFGINYVLFTLDLEGGILFGAVIGLISLLVMTFIGTCSGINWIQKNWKRKGNVK